MINNQSKHKDVTGLTFICILSALMALTSLSTDIYLPAMPIMTQELHGNVELTITSFLIGFCVGQLIWGPISDNIGRRKPLFIGITLFIIGSIGCAVSMDISQIVCWRIIQALGACTGPMLARAMIRDSFDLTRAVHMLSTLMIMMAIAPIAGPLIGGQIIKITSWHFIFWLLVVIGILMMLLLLLLPETLPIEKRNKISFSNVFYHYFVLFKNKNFILFTLCLTFYYVAAYAFITGSPFVYITYFHINPQYYGWLFALNIVGLMIVSMMNKRLLHIYSVKALLKCAVLIAALATLILAIGARLEVGNLTLVIISVFVFFSMNGIIAATSTAAALDCIKNATGSAAAFIGAFQYGSGVISSILLAMFKDGTPWTMAWIMAVFTIFSAIIALTIQISKREECSS